MRPRRFVARLVAQDGGLLVGLALLVLLATAVAVAAPRALASAADAAVRSGVAHGTVAQRTLTVQWVPAYRYYRGPPTSASALTTTGEDLRSEMRPALASVLGPLTWAAQSPAYEIRLADTGERPDPHSQQQIALRAQQDFAQHLEWVEGRAPRPGAADSDVAGAAATTFEVALSAAVADGLSVRVGDRLSTSPSQTVDPVVLEVVGTYTPDGSPAWDGDPRTVRPEVEQTPNTVIVTGAGLIDPQDLTRLDSLTTASLSRTWTAPVRAELLDTDLVATVLDDVGALRTAVGGSDGTATYVTSTDLDTVVTGLREQGDAVSRVWLASAVALATVALAALWFTADLLRRRRSGTFTLLRARGARAGAVGATVSSEVAVAVVPIAVLAAGATGFVVGARSWGTGLAAAVAVTTVAVVLPGALTWSWHRDRRRPGAGRLPWRPFAETLLAVVALAGWWLVRDSGAARPLLAAAVPTLLALLAGAVLLRLLELGRRVGRRAATRRPGPVGVVALARADGAGARGVVVVLVAAVATTGLASCLLASVAAAQERAAYERVGAQARVESHDPTLGDVLTGRPDGCGTAAASTDPGAVLVDESGRRPATLLLIDVPAYRATVAGTPLDAAALDPLEVPGDPAAALPVLVPSGLTAPDAVEVGGRAVPVRTVGTTPGWLRVGSVLPVVAATAAWPAAVVANRWYACGAVPDDALRAADPGVAVTTVGDELAATRDVPLVPTATAGVLAAAAAALVLGLACLLVAEAARRPDRLRDASLLRTLGSSRRERRAVALLAALPPALAAVAVGLAAGVGLTHVVLRSFGLAVVSDGVAPTLVVPWVPLAAVATTAVVLTVGAVVLGTIRDERAVLAAELRGGART